MKTQPVALYLTDPEDYAKAAKVLGEVIHLLMPLAQEGRAAVLRAVAAYYEISL